MELGILRSITIRETGLEFLLIKADRRFIGRIRKGNMVEGMLCRGNHI